MMKSKYKAMVLSCMDPRFQLPVFKFMKKKNLIGNIVLLQLLVQL
jgi:carbonic anhydrase